MERPARLCGLWALLLCAGGGAAPTGECGRGPGAATEGAAPVAADRGRGLRRRRALGGPPHDAPRSGTAASGARFEVGDPAATGRSRAAGSGRR